MFKIYNELNGDYFLIYKNNNVIEYSLTSNGTTELLFTSSPILSNSLFSVGINLNVLINTFGNNVSSFFGNVDNLKMYVAGDNSGENTFTGKIYCVGFETELNTTKIIEKFNSDGFILIDEGQELIDHTASYTLLPSMSYEKYFLDIGVAGYWEDYLPLSYFAKFVNNSKGEPFYDVDFLQFNVGYPVMGNLVEESGLPELYYNTGNAQIKSYITFQQIIDGANNPTSFVNNQALNEYKIIDIDNNENWSTTRFEALNSTLIYPNKALDFNSLAIVYSLEFDSRGILTKPILLSRLQLASQALNDNFSNPIGTRLGINLFPFKQSGIYFNYKTKKSI